MPAFSHHGKKVNLPERNALEWYFANSASFRDSVGSNMWYLELSGTGCRFTHPARRTRANTGRKVFMDWLACQIGLHLDYVLTALLECALRGQP